jgi:methionine sulfoxide reductase heme-binding subunit
MVYIYSQWLLTFKRTYTSDQKPQQGLNLHRWSGALAPVFFYIHSARFGYGYLLFISIIYFTNFIVGNINPQGLNIHRYINNYYSLWLRAHIIFSCLVSLMIIYHIYVVFYYK